jgi:hypothetical protein
MTSDSNGCAARRGSIGGWFRPGRVNSKESFIPDAGRRFVVIALFALNAAFLKCPMLAMALQRERGLQGGTLATFSGQECPTMLRSALYER